MSKPSEYVLDLFKKLREDISSIKHMLFTEKPKPELQSDTQRQYTINAVHKDAVPREKEDDFIRATLNLPESLRVEAITEGRHKRWFKDRTFCIQVAGIVVGIAVAGVYYKQLQAMQGQTEQSLKIVDLTRKTSERTDRAWIAIQPKGPFRIVAGGQLGFPFTLINTGKTPARHIHTEMWAKFIALNSTEELVEKGARLEMETGDLFPNNVNVMEIFQGTGIVRQRPKSPGSHETEAWPIDSGEVQSFLASRTYAVGYMVVSYDDIFHVHHWTRFCAFLQPPSGLADTSKCIAYNREDDNEEP